VIDGHDNDLSHNPHWLWSGEGQLLVVSTPYLIGKHYATNPLQLLALVEEVDNLHRKGYVHGDIRGFNVVFQDGVNDESNTATVTLKDKVVEVDLQGFRGRLIDYDFAGKSVDSPKYPKGFQLVLPDGARAGKAGDTIVEHHDWVGVRSILFRLHTMTPPAANTGEQEIENLRLREKQHLLSAKFSSAPTSVEIAELKSFLFSIHIRDWTIEPEFEYRIALRRVGLWKDPGTSPASGTPRKDIYQEGKIRG
jgi:hypothetical protein